MENEIEEAMSDTIQGAKDDKNDLDGKYITSRQEQINNRTATGTDKEIRCWSPNELTLTNQGSK